MREAIYMGNIQQTSRNRMDGKVSNVQRLLKHLQNQTHLLPTTVNTLNLRCHT